MSINTCLKIWIVAVTGLFWATSARADDIDSLRKGYQICQRHMTYRPDIPGCANAYKWEECNEIVSRWLKLVYSSANEVDSKDRAASAIDEADLAIVTKNLSISKTHTTPQ